MFCFLGFPLYKYLVTEILSTLNLFASLLVRLKQCLSVKTTKAHRPFFAKFREVSLEDGLYLTTWDAAEKCSIWTYNRIESRTN